jgi:DtxR family transcriptional regulator, manganese transport regulator
MLVAAEDVLGSSDRSPMAKTSPKKNRSPSVKKPGTRKASASRSTPEAKSQAHDHERVREAHSAELAEDYVEAIADLIAQTGVARGVDLKRHFGVSHVTVIRTIARLERDGLVTTQPYRPIELTNAGRRMASRAKRRHEAVLAFLMALGIDEKTARADAEGIEHHASPRTLRAFEAFVKAHEKQTR